MTDRIHAGQWHQPIGQPRPIDRVSGSGPSSSARVQPTFRSILNDKLIQFSHHAENRLEQRGIKLNPGQLEQLESAVNKAAAKGARESLILFKDVALIVNVKNRTVVTAMDGGQMKDNVFTQIDSAVIIS